MDILEEIAQAVEAGQWEASPQLAQEALGAGHEPLAVLQALVNAMDIVGEEWRAGNMFIPEVLLAARAMKGAMEILRPVLSDEDSRLRGSMVIGTVQGDLHDIGKSLVGMMVEGAGYQVIDLGVDVPPQAFVEAVKNYQPDLVAMSSLLTTTISYMRDTIRSLQEAGLRETVKVLVGGAPVTQNFADSIGADGYAPDGATAVMKVRELMGKAISSK